MENQKNLNSHGEIQSTDASVEKLDLSDKDFMLAHLKKDSVNNREEY